MSRINAHVLKEQQTTCGRCRCSYPEKGVRALVEAGWSIVWEGWSCKLLCPACVAQLARNDRVKSDI